jgi:dephospho-CoA kinase
MIHIGLTGGIGSGKSTVARMFGDFGAVVLDADRISRELTGPGCEASALICAEFGQEVMAPDGSVDRKALAAAVFGDEAGRRRLEGILHPRIVARRRGILNDVRRSRGEGAIVVSEAALIFEAGTQGEFDAVILVTAPEAARRERLEKAGWDLAAVGARMASQWPDEKKRPLARWVVENGGDPETTRGQVKRIWAEIQGGIRHA